MDKIKDLVNRLKEPSTYAGLGGAAILYGATAEQFQTWTAAVAGICLFISILLKEKA